MLHQLHLPLFPLSKLFHLSLKFGSLFPFSPQLSRHALYLTFPFPHHLLHIRFGPLNQISDLRLELNPLLPLYPYLPLQLLNRIRPFPFYSPKTKFYLLATPAGCASFFRRVFTIAYRHTARPNDKYHTKTRTKKAWADGNNYEMIESLNASTYQITRLISRISGRHFGMKGKNLVRLVRAFVVSRLAYVLPFLRLGAAEKAKLDCLIRKAYKRALGIPDSTSNEKLAALGLHNTVEKIVEAQRTSHLERLTKSAARRHILETLSIPYERQTGEKIDVPRRVREKLTIPNLPHHMHSVHHVERRTARAKAFRRPLEKEEGAARYKILQGRCEVRQECHGRGRG
ncbi:hypothetical protein HPB47_017685 [Ixodes persulcatus]|uniref:Uncharacterized protein n=1 Tax=Ixodes persulcatus TaxID=34615 RepID=A0AC60QMN8_IXOPE|nr:hypothetical protein HPB47_017685 [Ixodes persulcatus]